MSTDNLTQLTGIGDLTAKRLNGEGITTREELRKGLVELHEGIHHIYSTWRVPLVEDLNLPTAGDQKISQYELVEKDDDSLLYTWFRDSQNVFLELDSKEGDYKVTIYLGGGDQRVSKKVETRKLAFDQVTRWAYYPLEHFDSLHE